MPGWATSTAQSSLWPDGWKRQERGRHSRDLEGSGAQHAGSLILGHIWCGDPLLVGLRSLSRGEDLNVLLALLDTKAERGKSQGALLSEGG